MNYLITGGAGFIGSHLCDKLLDISNIIVVIDNYETGKRSNLQNNEKLVIIEDTIVNYEVLDCLMKKYSINYVIHCAASYKDPLNCEEDISVNILGTQNIIRVSKKYNVKKLIYFQTALCYGTNPLESPISLNHAILPEGSSYAISKTAGEQYIHLSGLKYITFRLANVYGPRNVSGPLPTFYKRICENKPCFVVNTKRDFVYIDDLVELVIKAVNNDNVSGTFHVSSGKDIYIKELWDATIKYMNINYQVEEINRNRDDAPSILLDPSYTENIFSWTTKTNIEDGVKTTIEYYKKHIINETYTHLTPSN